MLTPGLINYIQTSLAAGKSKDKIKSELLLAGGWQEAEVEEAFATLQSPAYTTSVKTKAGSFFLTFFIVIIILVGLGFAAEKYYGPVVNAMFSNIIAALPLHKTQPAPVVQPQAAATVLPTPVDSSAIPQAQTPTVSVPVINSTPLQTTLPAATVAPTPVTPVSTTPPVPVKCAANDSACLLQAVSSCAPATEINTTTATTPTNTKEVSTRTYKVYGLQPDNECRVDFYVNSDTVANFRTKAASCLLSTSDLSTVLTNWSTGDFYTDTGVDLYGKCSGTYFNN